MDILSGRREEEEYWGEGEEDWEII